MLFLTLLPVFRPLSRPVFRPLFLFLSLRRQIGLKEPFQGQCLRSVVFVQQSEGLRCIRATQ